MKKKKAKRIKTVNGEIPLPEAMIQHIQSFLGRKEAARTTILSKSWYNAWLTRPMLDFDTRDFHNLYPEPQHVFEEFVIKTMKRYQTSSLKIDSFRLCSYGSYDWDRKLIVDGIKMGATTIKLEQYKFPLPPDVLGSETLLKLSIISSKVDGNYNIRCSRLNSLTLENVDINKDGMFKDMITCCILMEELSLSYCFGLELSLINLYGLHKLRRLLLDNVVVHSLFFIDFAYRFPCLKDLSILQCYGCSYIQFASTSLDTICLKTDKVSEVAKFDVPNIRKFTYSCPGLPSHLSISGPSREWHFDISIESNRLHKMSWFIKLKRLLKKFKLSRISLHVDLYYTKRLQCSDSEHEVDVEVVPKPLVVENLTIKAPPTFYSVLVVRLLGAFRPKFITHCDCNSYALACMQDGKVKSIRILRKRLISTLFASNWQDMFGQFCLKKVNVEIYDRFDAEWQPLQLNKAKADSKAKVRLELIWED